MLRSKTLEQFIFAISAFRVLVADFQLRDFGSHLLIAILSLFEGVLVEGAGWLVAPFFLVMYSMDQEPISAGSSFPD